MTKSAAIVTLIVGEPYLTYWQTYCEAGWKQYADKYDLDLIVLTEPLDTSELGQSRSVAWQKCLILSQSFSSNYDRIIWLDADIAINVQKAPFILNDVPEERIGAVFSGAYLHPDYRPIVMERQHGKTVDYAQSADIWRAEQRFVYRLYQMEQEFDEVIQTGVLVFSPTYHRDLMEQVYYTPRAVEGRCYEQVPLSHEILKQDLVTPLNSRFNLVFYERMVLHYPYLMNPELDGYDFMAGYAVATEFANSFFLHFAYESRFMEYLFFV